MKNSEKKSNNSSNSENFAESEKIGEISDFLDNKMISKLQLKINDLVLSNQNLAKKREILAQIKQKIFGELKAAPQCFSEIQNLSTLLFTEKEKIDFAVENLKISETKFKDLQTKITNFVNLKKSEEKEPLLKKQAFEDEIENLKKSIQAIQKTKLAIESKKQDKKNREDEISKLQNSISLLENEISFSNTQKTADGKKLEDAHKKLKMLEGRFIIWEMKLELSLRNKNIKEFLLTLVNTKDGKQNDLQALFFEKIGTEKELKSILKEFIKQSKSNKDGNEITEEQMDAIISQDEEDFEAIARLYKELVKIVSEYKDIDLDIENIRIHLEQITSSKKTAQREIEDTQRIIVETSNLNKEKRALISVKQTDIGLLQAKIAKDDDFINHQSVDTKSLELSLQSAQGGLRLLKEQFKVN